MAFTIPFVPPKKVSFPEDPLLPKIVYDEVVKDCFSDTNQTYATSTLLFMAPEQLPGKCQIKQAKQDDLMKVDIWQLGMTLFCLVNPGLNAPFDIASSTE